MYGTANTVFGLLDMMDAAVATDRIYILRDSPEDHWLAFSGADPSVMTHQEWLLYRTMNQRQRARWWGKRRSRFS